MACLGETQSRGQEKHKHARSSIKVFPRVLKYEMATDYDSRHTRYAHVTAHMSVHARHHTRNTLEVVFC